MIVADIEMQGVHYPKLWGFWNYGLAYRYIAKRESSYYPIPFNFIMAWLIRISDRLHYTNYSKYELELIKVFEEGRKEGIEIGRKHTSIDYVAEDLLRRVQEIRDAE